jgi:DNA-binding response OmpR family regulator
MLTPVNDPNQANPSILHVCGRETILALRDDIFRLSGFEVTSTLDLKNALILYSQRPYTLVLVDVEGEGRVVAAEHLCGEIKHENPDQMVAFLCNYRVAITSDCPDEIIHAEFNPAAMIKGVKELLVPAEQ